MDAMPWFAWIVLAAIASYTLVEIVSTLVRRSKKDNQALTDALKANTKAQTATEARLDAVENRLAAIEKTLTDIP